MSSCKNMIFYLCILAYHAFAESLEGKVAVVTGASSGIGKTVSQELAAKGVKVVLAARRTSNLYGIVEAIKVKGGTAVAKKCDISRGSDVKSLMNYAEEVYGRIDFVFANAAIDGPHWKVALHETDDDALQELFDINVVGTLFTLKYALQTFLRQGGGTIAFSGSIASFVPADLHFTQFPGFKQGSTITYHATKQAIDRIAMEAWSAYRDDNIRVYNFNIGAFSTELGDRVGFGKPGSPIDLNPVSGIVGDPIFIAQAITHILDGSSKWPPGSTLLIDNDMTMDAHHFYTQIYAPHTRKMTNDGNLHEKLWRQDMTEMRKHVFDLRGNAYNWKNEL